jgi:hypothetical protein
MMRTVTRYVARTGLIFGFASALGLSVAHTSVNAQTSVARPKALANATLEPAPKALTGTLFNTREQRENLDRARLRSGLVEDEVASPADPEPSVINGFVKRSDGRDTVWVDDVMKRDPRAEVVGELEPNLVGGSASRVRVGAFENATKKPSDAEFKVKTLWHGKPHRTVRHVSKISLRKGRPKK